MAHKKSLMKKLNQFSMFQDIESIVNPTTIDLQQAAVWIKHDAKIKAIVQEIRKEPDKKARNEIKMKLPCFCFSGVFQKRSKDGIEKHSGLICMDFDGIPAEEMQAFYKDAIQDQYTRMLFMSPSGNGYKIIIGISPDIEKHEGHFLALAQHYQSPYLDMTGKDVSRVCYASHDENIFIREEAPIFQGYIEPKQPKTPPRKTTEPTATTERALEVIDGWVNNQLQYADGNKHQHAINFAGAANRAGISEQDCIDYYQSNYDKQNVPKIIGSFYRLYPSEHGTKPIGSAPDATVSIETFWSVATDKNGNTKITFKRFSFVEWIFRNGWGRYNYTPEDWVLVLSIDNIVDVKNKPELKKFVFEYIASLPEKFDGTTRQALNEHIARGVSTFFSSELLELLPSIQVETHIDEIDTAWIFYKNAALKISPTGSHLVQYAKLQCKIWRAQILDRDYTHTSQTRNDFQDFVSIVSGVKKYKETPKYTANLKAFQTTIGYIIHGYKDPSFCPAVILNDAFNDSDDPNGGTGKGIFLRALKAIREVVMVDGKNWSPDKSFAFQFIQPSTQIVAFEDVQKNFSFETFFSITTEGFRVEKKGKESYHVPFPVSPKIIITTNYAISGEGSSHERRRIELELDDYFISTPPYEHFGHRLFDDWDTAHWQRFDAYMVYCTELFLRDRITKMDTANLRERKLRELTHPVFVEWFSEAIRYNEKVTFSYYHMMLCQYNSDFQKYNQNTITRFIKAFCKHYGIEYNIVRIGDGEGRKRGIECTTLGRQKVVTSGISVEKVVQSGQKVVTEVDENDDLPF